MNVRLSIASQAVTAPQRVRRALTCALLVATGVGLAGCSGSETSGPDGPVLTALAPFVGTWDASSFVHTAKADSTLVIDIIAEGTSFVLVIQSAGTYSATATLANTSQVETGNIRLVGTQLILAPTNPPGAEGAVTFGLNGSTMTWDGDSEWDFASDGIPEITSVRIVFRKR